MSPLSSRPRRLLAALPPATALLVLACGRDAGSPTGPASSPAFADAAGQPLTFRQVSAGFKHTCGVTTDDRAYCWGSDSAGQLGDGKTTNSGRPVAVAGGLRFLEVRAGDSHSCGVTTTGHAYCWGANGSGQLGDGTRSERHTPVAVAGGRRFGAIRAGYRHTCALTPADAPFCWGDNSSGQLGDNSTITRLTPVRVRGGLYFVRVTAGAIHSCGVTSDRRAWCWGRNDNGELGDGTLRLRLKPVAVAGGHAFRQIWAGTILNLARSHTCGITTDDRAWCWGYNSSGQLGDGTTSRRLVPRAVSGGIAFQGISAGLVHSCGVGTTNQAYCWGSNGNFQIGDGSSLQDPDRLTPTAVTGGIRFESIGAGGFHTCAVATDGRAYCWGNNFAGQLGIGFIDGNPFSPHSSPTGVVAP